MALRYRAVLAVGSGGIRRGWPNGSRHNVLGHHIAATRRLRKSDAAHADTESHSVADGNSQRHADCITNQLTNQCTDQLVDASVGYRLARADRIRTWLHAGHEGCAA